MTTSGLQYTDIVIGTGPMPAEGQMAAVHYRGTLPDGTVFDSSRDRAIPTPLKFVVGQGRLVKGFEEGVKTMRVGGRRTLIIPPDLGYGPEGRPPSIPAHTNIIFDVELVSVK
jgi:peptidylprolyl isomerase